MIGQLLGAVKRSPAVPALTGLVVLCLVFGFMRPVFFTAGNLANLTTQAAQVMVIAMGLVFVLLLGEIDLSAGFASGVCAGVLAITLAEYQFPWYLSVLVSIATGTLIGLLLGFLVAKIGIPSFVVTLAAFLAFQGVALLLLKEGRNVSVREPIIVAIANRNLYPWLGWALCAFGVLAFAAVQFVSAARRRAKGVTAERWQITLAKVITLAVLSGALVFVLNEERSANPLFASLKGVPIVVPIVVMLLVLWTFVLRRTAYGRHLYAVGGNKEAARRAGINVDRLRISAFVICSTMAAIGGIIAASRANSVDPNTGGSNVLLYAVGAAVIGGTSLFGGKGRIIDAVIGGLVVAVIENGMSLMGYGSGIKYVVTGVVLLLAAGVDALSRKRTEAGR
jgi:D-xylose transport system permease protein